MKRNDIASFFYYMWNAWSEQECKIAFVRSSCGWRHLWNKWCQYSTSYSRYGAVEEFFANLDDKNQDLLVERAIELYNKKQRIK